MIKISEILPDKEERKRVKEFIDMFHAQWFKIFDGDKLVLFLTAQHKNVQNR